MITVKSLREALKDAPDDAVLVLSSDTGVDQGAGEIVIENVYMSPYWNEFVIYANDVDPDEEEFTYEDNEK